MLAEMHQFLHAQIDVQYNKTKQKHKILYKTWLTTI